LNCEGDALAEFGHAVGFGGEGWIFLQAFEVLGIGAVQVGSDGFVVVGLDDDADLFDAGGDEFHEVIVDEGAGDSVGAYDGEEFFFDGVGCGEVAGAEACGGDYGFADGGGLAHVAYIGDVMGVRQYD
jgi:hypothetical protein